MASSVNTLPSVEHYCSVLSMGQHYNPQTRPYPMGSGTETLTLGKEAQTAWSLWHAMLLDRMCEAHPKFDPDHVSRVHYDRIESTLTKHAGTLLGDLLNIAVADARTRTLPNPKARHADQDGLAMAGWDMAVRLQQDQIRLDPPKPLVYDQSTHCRHGQPYSGDCAECDEDF